MIFSMRAQERLPAHNPIPSACDRAIKNTKRHTTVHAIPNTVTCQYTITGPHTATSTYHNSFSKHLSIAVAGGPHLTAVCKPHHSTIAPYLRVPRTMLPKQRTCETKLKPANDQLAEICGNRRRERRPCSFETVYDSNDTRAVLYTNKRWLPAHSLKQMATRLSK